MSTAPKNPCEPTDDEIAYAEWAVDGLTREELRYVAARNMMVSAKLKALLEDTRIKAQRLPEAQRAAAFRETMDAAEYAIDRDRAEIAARARKASASKAGKARAAKYEEAKEKVYREWRIWQDNPADYSGAAEFAKKMCEETDIGSVITNYRTISESWHPEWKRQLCERNRPAR